MDPETPDKPPRRSTRDTRLPSEESPPPRADKVEAEDQLESWKEIAAFVGRDERTLMRWAKQQGMPIHRIPGSKRSRVSASRAEISYWLSRRDESQPGAAQDMPEGATAQSDRTDISHRHRRR